MRRVIVSLLFLLNAAATLAEDIVALPTRGEVTQRYLLSAPEPGKALAIAVLFPGGDGRTDLERESARTVLDRGNFLVRSRQIFAANGIVAAVVDVPSDRAGGMDDLFRLSESHTEDIGKVADDLRRRFPGVPLFLVGTSRSTVSAAAAGKRLGKAVDGVVLTATLFLASGRQPGLSGFDFSAIPAPVLLVHHVNDGCTYTPFASAKRLADRFPLISVSGGLPPQSAPCEAMAPHGFLGKERETVEAIVNWMLKKPYNSQITQRRQPPAMEQPPRISHAFLS